MPANQSLEQPVTAEMIEAALRCERQSEGGYVCRSRRSAKAEAARRIQGARK